METTTYNLIVLFLSWLVYFVIHSYLASISFKDSIAKIWDGLMPAYRIIYNAVSLLLLIPLLRLISSFDTTTMLWEWKGGMSWLCNSLAILAIIGFLWSFRYYDTKEFLGVSQWLKKKRAVEDKEGFKLSPLHRFVRHPWYFFGMVIIWTREMDISFLVSAIAISSYFIIGSRLEEKRLLLYYGETYRLYMERVSGLFPLPWRYLSPDEALDLLEFYRKSKD